MDYSIVQNDSGVHPNAYQCGTKTTWGWGLVDFLPKSGKTVGIWPYEFTVSNLTTLRTHWGYSKLFFAYYMDNNKWNIAISAGYSLEDIMISVTTYPDANRYDLIEHYGNAYAYYVDEPADQNHSMGQVRSSLDALQLSSLFVISGYKRTYGLNVCVEQADKVMFSAYKHWWETWWGWWSWPVDDDQRPDWTDMQNRYGNKFSMTWINTKEISEFDDLFGHAKNLGLDAVWIYGFTENGGQPVPHYNDQFENISYAAFAQGFLRQRQREYRIEWRCDNPDPCVNCDPTLPDGWYIDEVFPTAFYRIIEN